MKPFFVIFNLINKLKVYPKYEICTFLINKNLEATLKQFVQTIFTAQKKARQKFLDKLSTKEEDKKYVPMSSAKDRS